MIMKKPFVAGNWKMNTDSHTSVTLAKRLATGSSDVAGHNVTVAVCPPFVYLESVAKALSASSIAVGAQDVYFERDGAFTGEISAKMLKDIGCTYVICGHSERRQLLAGFCQYSVWASFWPNEIPGKQNKLSNDRLKRGLPP
jgi:triosephosphate isomerase